MSVNRKIRKIDVKVDFMKSEIDVQCPELELLERPLIMCLIVMFMMTFWGSALGIYPERVRKARRDARSDLRCCSWHA